jgi:hypothetical protein
VNGFCSDDGFGLIGIELKGNEEGKGYVKWSKICREENNKIILEEK